tara:strand:+ start:254 stop:943 length:690 start_codon:yes stop_codon:yes gene_type:complete
MSNTVYVYHHLGLGDHMICNGLVRRLAENIPDDITLVVKNRNFNNVSRMYSDAPKIKFFPVEEDSQFTDFCNTHRIWDQVIKIGFESCRMGEFDKSFYDCVGMPFHHRWDSWGLKRDYDQEAKVAAELNIQGDYIFVHNTSSEESYDIQIESNLPQIKPQKLESEKSIFDWLGVIENAKEVHCVDSSFIHMIDSYGFSNKKVYHNIRLALSKSGVGFTLRQDWQRAIYG